MNTEILNTIPVLPSEDIAWDIGWYQEKMGLEVFRADGMYAVLFRENLIIHLQWHANMAEDPLLGGSVVRLYVKDISHILDELVGRATVAKDKFRQNTPWQTNEFGFYDLNGNSIFFMEDIYRGS